MTVSSNSFFVTSYQATESGEYRFNTHQQSNSQSVDAFIDRLHQKFSARNGKVFFNFETAEDYDVQFKDKFIDVEKGNLEFKGVFEELLANIKKNFELYAIAEGAGHIVVAHYEQMATQYLYFAVLDNPTHYTLNEDNQISEQHYIDGTGSIIAARICLTDMAVSESTNKPVALVVKGASRKYRDFFSDCFSCQEVTSAKKVTRDIVTAIESYAKSETCSDEEFEGIEVKELAFKELSAAADEGREINIKEMSAVLSPDTDSFASFCAQSHPEVEETVSVDKTTAKQLVQYKGVGAGLTVSFPEKMLGERVKYDAATDTLTITGVPPNLRDQLNRNYVAQNEQSIEQTQTANA